MKLVDFVPARELERIRLHARSKAAETCGVIVDNKKVLRYPAFFAVTNVSKNPESKFAFDPSEWDDLKATAVCIVHSHHLDSQPGQLTPSDIEAARVAGLPTLLYHAAFDVWDYWHPYHWNPYPLQVPKLSEDLEGWAFEYGRSDCWSIVRSYYALRWGMCLRDYPRGEIEELESESFAPFTEEFKDFGFIEIFDEIWRDGDLLILRVGKQPTHCAVVCDAKTGTALHHLGPDILSKKFSIERWKNKIVKRLRYGNSH